MPDTTVNLDVQTVGANGPPTGYSLCKGNTGYCYQFTGGNVTGKPGSFAFTHGTGSKSVDVSLLGTAFGAGFAITNVGFIYDNASDQQDLSIDPTNKTGRTWTITDSDLVAESGYFAVIVSKGTDTGITCDPRWQNN